MDKLKPCPFCGKEIDTDKMYTFQKETGHRLFTILTVGGSNSHSL